MTSIDKIIELFKRKNLRLESGLSGREIQDVETRFQFRFPPDLRSLLQMALPVSKKFYHWRKALVDTKTAEQIQKMLDWPRDGILFDVEHNNFWVGRCLPDVSAWGQKPEILEKQFDIAKTHIATYPRLIPIYSHRYIPETPHEENNPVFSVYQTDIIYYGSSIANYFLNEFCKKDKLKLPREMKRIPFWSDCCDCLFNG